MLVEILKPDFHFEDDRGVLDQLVRGGYSQVNVVSSHKDVFRGGHYHKENIEFFFVVEGSFRLILEKDGEKEEYLFKKGDMFRLHPYVIHSFYYLEESIVLAMYDKGVEHADGTMDSYKV